MTTSSDAAEQPLAGEPPLILVSNDDGYDAPGIIELAQALRRFAKVVVCAPRDNQSASSHSLTLHGILRLVQTEDAVFALNGTPADCVYVALHSGIRVLPRTPDLVLSGINRGPNLGVDVVYSGTVAAAREGAQRGIPALAVSAHARADLTAAAALAASVAEQLLASVADTDGGNGALGQPLRSLDSRAALLNLNIPAGHSWPLRATRLGRRHYEDGVIYRRDPRNGEYLWIGGANVQHDADEDTDTAAWDRGEASLTPLVLDLFDTRRQGLSARLAAAVDDAR